MGMDNRQIVLTQEPFQLPETGPVQRAAVGDIDIVYAKAARHFWDLEFMVIGLPLNADNYWGIVVSPFFVIALNKLVIEREEEYLGGKFPKEYMDYKSRVRRWL